MAIIGFVAFLLVGHLIAMLLFRLTTYHACFWWSAPILVGYSALSGWLLFTFGLHPFFLWWVVVEAIWLFNIGRKQAAGVRAMAAVMGSAEGADLAAGSGRRTVVFFWLSAAIYLGVFSLTYLYVYNQ